MNTMKKLFLMSGLLVLNATVFAASKPVKLLNNTGKLLTASFGGKKATNGRTFEAVDAGGVKQVAFTDTTGELTITWKDGNDVIKQETLTINTNSAGLYSTVQ